MKVTEEGQITDRFSKAIEHLGSEQLSIRLGGIYALERIARDSKADHWTVMEVLSAFIRNYKPDTSSQDDDTLGAFFNNYGSENKKEEILEELKKPVEKEGLPKLPLDVQAALTIIGKRNVKNDPQETYLDLSGSFLQRADLKDANLVGGLATKKWTIIERLFLLRKNEGTNKILLSLPTPSWRIYSPLGPE